MSHRFLRAGLVAALAVLTFLVGGPPALADGTSPPTPSPSPSATTLRLVLAGGARAGEAARLSAVLVDAAGQPVTSAPLLVQRWVGGAWDAGTSTTTDESGTAQVDVTLSTTPGDNVWQAHYDGSDEYLASSSAELAVQPDRYTTALALTGPRTVVDGRLARLVVTWRTDTGLPVPATVTVNRRVGGTWRVYRRIALGADGRAVLSVRPRVDTRWRAVGPRGYWYRFARSAVHVLDNVPPGLVVRLPAGTPQPTITLPPQPRALGRGANPHLTRIPSAVWSQMVGRSWHSGCPVGRAGLSYLRVNYWGFDGYRHRGELVVNRNAAARFAAAFAGLYRNRVPIRSMYRPDRFGWSAVLRGANDYRSMEADNTSAFNCRGVANKPGVLSPHATGYAVDINTWENPYACRLPNRYWCHHSLRNPATWRSRSALVVQVLARHGLRWTYGMTDIQHFDA